MSIESRFTPMRKTNRPEGNNQFDYIIRIGEEMKERERESGEKFRAIGILGSDVYDKLLLLQALRPLFPNVAFFTTDLDASFTHPQELEWTKNLLVASSHGLALNEKLQCGAAPFRFSYQTSIFQSVLGAITFPPPKGDAIRYHGRSWENDILLKSSEPRLFEIGWDKAYDISVKSSLLHPPLKGNSTFLDWVQHGISGLVYSVFGIIYFIFGPGIFLFTVYVLNRHRNVLGAVGSILVFLGIGPKKTLKRRWKAMTLKVVGTWKIVRTQWIDKILKETKVDDLGSFQCGDSEFFDKLIRLAKKMLPYFNRRFVTASIRTLISMLAVLFIYDTYRIEGEYFYWGSGISVWPTIMIWLIAAIWSSLLFFKALGRSRSVRKKLQENFYLRILKSERRDISFSSMYKAISDMLFNKKESNKAGENTEITIDSLWRDVKQDIPKRVAGDVIIFGFMLITILYLLFCQGNGHLPFRGGISYLVGMIIRGAAWTCTLSLVFTTFFITRTCCRFIKRMTEASVVWSLDKHDLPGAIKKWNIDKNDVSDLIDVHFIGAWTSRISNLVLYPTGSLILLAAAELAYFDNYGSNNYRYIVWALMILLVFVPAFRATLFGGQIAC